MGEVTVVETIAVTAAGIVAAEHIVIEVVLTAISLHVRDTHCNDEIASVAELSCDTAGTVIVAAGIDQTIVVESARDGTQIGALGIFVSVAPAITVIVSSVIIII